MNSRHLLFSSHLDINLFELENLISGAKNTLSILYQDWIFEEAEKKRKSILNKVFNKAAGLNPSQEEYNQIGKEKVVKDKVRQDNYDLMLKKISDMEILLKEASSRSVSNVSLSFVDFQLLNHPKEMLKILQDEWRAEQIRLSDEKNLRNFVNRNRWRTFPYDA